MVNKRMTWHILVADAISDHGLQQLTNAPDVHVDKAIGWTEDQLVDRIGAYDALLVRSQTKVTARIMDAAPKLRVIGRAGVGVDNIDLPHATKRGMIVINAPDGNTITTCEHTFAMMMALARHIPQAYRKTIEGTWDRKTFVGVELLVWGVSDRKSRCAPRRLGWMSSDTIRFCPKQQQKKSASSSAPSRTSLRKQTL
jgi:D-3-phosphoglycerate dehydrogenase